MHPSWTTSSESLDDSDSEGCRYQAKPCHHRRLPLGRLVHESSSDRQVLLFSATWPRYVETFVFKFCLDLRTCIKSFLHRIESD